MGKTIGLLANNLIIVILYAALLILGYNYLHSYIFLVGAVVFTFGVIFNDMIVNKKGFTQSCKDNLILILLLEIIFVVLSLIALMFSVDALESTGITYQVWCYTIFTFLSIVLLLVKDGIYWLRIANLKIEKLVLKPQGIKLLVIYLVGIVAFILLMFGLNQLYDYVIFDSDLEQSLAIYLPYAALFGIWRTVAFNIINKDAEKYYEEKEEEFCMTAENDIVVAVQEENNEPLTDEAESETVLEKEISQDNAEETQNEEDKNNE